MAAWLRPWGNAHWGLRCLGLPATSKGCPTHPTLPATLHFRQATVRLLRAFIFRDWPRGREIGGSCESCYVFPLCRYDPDRSGTLCMAEFVAMSVFLQSASATFRAFDTQQVRCAVAQCAMRPGHIAVYRLGKI